MYNENKYDNKNSVVLYQDGTSEAEFFAFSDVFQNSDGRYMVKTIIGYPLDSEDGTENPIITTHYCDNLEDVFKKIEGPIQHHEPNTCRDMIGTLLSRFLSHTEWKNNKLAKMSDLEMIKTNQKLIDILYKESLNGAWIHNKEKFGIRFDQYLIDSDET